MPTDEEHAKNGFWIIVLLAVVCGIGIGIGIAGCAAKLDEAAWKAKAIELGHAEYNRTTGKWQWKTLPKDFMNGTQEAHPANKGQ